MTNARVDKVHADRVGAREFFAQAEMFLADADMDSLSAPSRVILLHNATVCACDAILQAIGLRVRPAIARIFCGLRPRLISSMPIPRSCSNASMLPARGATKRPMRRDSSRRPACPMRARRQRSSSSSRVVSWQAKDGPTLLSHARRGPSRWLKVVVAFESESGGSIRTAFPRRSKP